MRLFWGSFTSKTGSKFCQQMSNIGDGINFHLSFGGTRTPVCLSSFTWGGFSCTFWIELDFDIQFGVSWWKQGLYLFLENVTKRLCTLLVIWPFPVVNHQPVWNGRKSVDLNSSNKIWVNELYPKDLMNCVNKWRMPIQINLKRRPAVLSQHLKCRLCYTNPDNFGEVDIKWH